MGINGYRPIANLPGTATSLDDDSLAAALDAATKESKPRHVKELEKDRLTREEVMGLVHMGVNGSIPLTNQVVAALEREVRRLRGIGVVDGNAAGSEGQARASDEQESIQYATHELKARLLKGKPIRSWIRELQVMWRDALGAQHSAFLKARDGTEQGRGTSGFIDQMEIDGQAVTPPMAAGSFVSGTGGFKLLLVESRGGAWRVEDEFRLTVEGVLDMGVVARVAHPLMQTVAEAQAHFNVHIVQLNHTEGIHGVLGQTFRSETSCQVRSLRYRLLTRLLREPVDVESASGRGFLDGRMEDYVTSSIQSPDCMYAAAWRRGDQEGSDGSHLTRR
ncbi:hypothetical protein CLOP_g9360 [Closterium sp. NIES-67]|nr:hypothetical protein CLOP_g9360 [Closterium sp. NIES-67]